MDVGIALDASILQPSVFYRLRLNMTAFVWAVIFMIWLVGTGLCDDVEELYDMPVTEADDVINNWLDANGFSIYRPSTAPGAVIMLAEKGRQQLRITARRSSPLAARIRIEVIKGPAQSSASRLQQFLMGYIQPPNDPSAPAHTALPNVVRGYADAVVCIYVNDNDRNIQLTGFAVDIEGLVICTAHDLGMDQFVDVLLPDGRRMAGRVIKIDRQRDLALIQVSHALDSVISLRNGRFMLNDGDTLFAVTCSNDGVIRFHSGSLDGPPRRVGGMPLWQVRMQIDSGSSGSPVFDSHGRLAAIVRGRFRGSDAIGFLTPFETLLHFLGRY